MRFQTCQNCSPNGENLQSRQACLPIIALSSRALPRFSFWPCQVVFPQFVNAALALLPPILSQASQMPHCILMLQASAPLSLCMFHAGFAGLHIVQMNGIQFTPAAHDMAEGVDATLEYYPNHYNAVQQWPLHKTLSTPSIGPAHYFGAHCGWDNTPRHITDGKYHQTLMHPSVYAPDTFGT